MLCLVTSLLFSSGCAALLLVGAGGTAGYLIGKGEEGDTAQKKETAESGEKSSSKTNDQQEGAFLLKEED